LPRLREQHAADAPPTPPVQEPDHQPGRHILVIDDEESVLDVVRRFLEIAGHRVSAATTGAAGLEMLEKTPAVDLIILDLMIPREEGSANFRRLRQRFPKVPVLLCTGLVPADQAAQLLRDGAADLLRKPFRMNDLWAAVNKLLKD
jgi:CheY-like chemotaxis protein